MSFDECAHDHTVQILICKLIAIYLFIQMTATAFNFDVNVYVYRFGRRTKSINRFAKVLTHG